MADGGAVQWGVEGLLTLAVAIGGGIVKAIRDDHKDLRKEHDSLAGEIPRTYARRDDVSSAFQDLKDETRRMNEKLDRLIERRYGGNEQSRG